MSMTSSCGPLRHATLVVAELRPLIEAYRPLGLEPGAHRRVSAGEAEAWQRPELAGCATVSLSAHDAPPLLRLIELPGARPRPTRFSHGWLALEVLVRDVDELGRRLQDSAFEIVGAPADLAVSPAIRAMQVIGPAGEMLYLTQIKHAVPPFELPLSAQLSPEQDLGPLFIGVMSVPSREAALDACSTSPPRPTFRFDTRVTVLSRALERPLDHPWPVATVQWEGASLFEIDEVNDARLLPSDDRQAPLNGLSWLTMDGPAGMQQISPGVWLERCEPTSP